MSFSSNCKNEILENDFSDRSIAEALVYGLFSFSSGVNAHEVLITSENAALLETIAFCMISIGVPEKDIEIYPGPKLYSLTITDPDAIYKILDRFDLLIASSEYELNDSIVFTNETVKAYIIGAFLGCGTVSDPSKGYHLQFSTHHSKRAYTLFDLLNSIGIGAKITKNGYSTILYYKNSSTIEDLLTYMGAYTNSMALMEMKVYKDVRNTVTRRVNCESANLEKVIMSSSDDIALINDFFKHGGASILKDDMINLAKMRIKYPEFSYTELASIIGNGLTKSGVNHRLRKLREIMRDYLAENGNKK